MLLALAGCCILRNMKMLQLTLANTACVVLHIPSADHRSRHKTRFCLEMLYASSAVQAGLAMLHYEI